KNDDDQHNTSEMETGLPQDAVAKNACSDLQKPGVRDETHGDESKPGHDHKRSGRNQTETSAVRPTGYVIKHLSVDPSCNAHAKRITCKPLVSVNRDQFPRRVLYKNPVCLPQSLRSRWREHGVRAWWVLQPHNAPRSTQRIFSDVRSQDQETRQDVTRIRRQAAFNQLLLQHCIAPRLEFVSGFPFGKLIAVGDLITNFEDKLNILHGTGEVPIRLNFVGNLVVICRVIFVGPERRVLGTGEKMLAFADVK